MIDPSKFPSIVRAHHAERDRLGLLRSSDRLPNARSLRDIGAQDFGLSKKEVERARAAETRSRNLQSKLSR